MKLLVITQKVDEKDDLLGFFVDWLREFAKHFEHVSVIALGVGSYELPKNVAVYSCGKERGMRRPFRWARFLWLLIVLIPRSSGIFAHMSPAFALTAWPMAAITGKKVVLWYLHRSVTLKLKLSELLCHRIVTADVESLGITSKKVIAVGHGIDMERFRTTRDWTHGGTFKIVSIGRISPIKNYETLLAAVQKLKLANSNFHVRIIGRPVMRGDNEYLGKLQELSKQLSISDIVQFVGFVPYDEIADEYKAADAVVGMTPHGGIDKAILEGMASGALTLTSNDVMKKYLGDFTEELLFPYGNGDILAAKLRFLIELPLHAKSELSKFLVESVSRHHDIHTTIGEITQLFKK